MAYKLVTCPESGHLELIELADHPLGLLISDCSAWRGCTSICARTCAARMDRKLRDLEPFDLDVGDTTVVDLLAALA
jgi:hypothetical protein